MSAIPRRILPVIVLSQFACTSLWFAGNAILPDLDLPSTAVGPLTSAVQFGFITGTLAFALLTIADRFSPSRVFFVCGLLAALANLGVLWAFDHYPMLLTLRALTGFLLAGIYPVGMKIASDWHREGLGKALGYLVGALVLGTAFPHLVRSLTQTLPWTAVILATSTCALLGGLAIVLLVPDGPNRRPGRGLDLGAIGRIFANRRFRAAAFGYFGHMWEVYTFWALAPVLWLAYLAAHGREEQDVSFLAFVSIAAGGIGCIIGGYLSLYIGSRRTAILALTSSGLCCLLFPLAVHLPFVLFLLYILIWGLTVAADSPQFSTLVAQSADPTRTGTALTITNCIGFAITIVSLQLVTPLVAKTGNPWLLWILAAGPAVGLTAVARLSGKGSEYLSAVR